MTTSPETAIADINFEDIVARQTQESKTVGDLDKNVKENVQRTTQFFERKFGTDGASLMSSNLEKMSNIYRRNLTSSLRKNFDIDKNAPEDVAAYNRKGGDNGIAVADTMLATDQVMEDPEYLERLRIHEETHKNLQAAEFDLDTLQLPDKKPVSVVGDMTEWQSIRRAKQPDSELVPDYIEHAENGDAVVEFLGAGAREKVYDALKTGEMQALQDEIDEKAEREEDTDESADGGEGEEVDETPKKTA